MALLTFECPKCGNEDHTVTHIPHDDTLTVRCNRCGYTRDNVTPLDRDAHAIQGQH